MARVKKCAICAHANPSGELFCGVCGGSLADVPVCDSTAELIHPASQPETATQPEPVRVQPHLVFEWGAVQVTDVLRIGRDSGFSSIACHIGAYDTVSRQHAEVFSKEGILFVRHLSKTNATYVGDRALDPGDVQPLNNGDEVFFSKGLRAVVRVS